MPDLSPDVERELEALDDALAGRPVAPDLTELGELALLLREDRPEPDDGFGRSLDTRVKRGFPKGDPRVRASGRRWLGWMVPALGATAAVLVFVLMASTAEFGSDDEEAGGGATTAMESTEQEAAGGAGSAPQAADSARSSDNDAGAGDQASSLAAPESVPPAPSPGSPGGDARKNRSIERSASLTLAARPRDIDRVSGRIQAVTSEQGGFVVTSSVNSSRSGGHATFQLRIPTRNLDDALAALSRLGAVRERSQRSQDITAETVSARSRLQDAKTERKSLLEQLADADTVQKTESIRARLDLVSREIENARADVRRVNNRAAFSTVVVELVADRSAAAPGAEEDDGGWTPGDAASDALRVLEVIAGVALIALAVALPLALLGLLGAAALRFTRRRRREHALDAV